MLPSPLDSPVLRDDLPRYPPLMQLCRVTANTVPVPPGSGSVMTPPNIYASYTQQMRTDTFTPRDRETCVVNDVNGSGLAAGYYNCRLINSYTATTTVAASIVGSGVAQALTPASMSGILNGMVVLVDTGTAQEQALITSVTGTTFTCIVTNNHTGPVTVVALCPMYEFPGGSGGISGGIVTGTVDFGTSGSAGTSPPGILSLPDLTVAGPPTWTPAANTYPIEASSNNSTIWWWNGTKWITIGGVMGASGVAGTSPPGILYIPNLTVAGPPTWTPAEGNPIEGSSNNDTLWWWDGAIWRTVGGLMGVSGAVNTSPPGELYMPTMTVSGPPTWTPADGFPTVWDNSGAMYTWSGSAWLLSGTSIPFKADSTGLSATTDFVYTVPILATYRVGVYLNFTTISTKTVEMRISYKDENNSVQIQSFYPHGATTAPITSGTANVAISYPTIDIRANSGNTITVEATVAGAGTLGFDCGVTIQRLR